MLVYLGLTLTDVQIKAEAPSGVRRRVSDGGGLLLEIDPAGGKYWIWRHRYPPSKDGKQQDYRIGPYPKISLKKARQIRDEQRKRMLIEGINPCAAKRQEKVERHHALPKAAPCLFRAPLLGGTILLLTLAIGTSSWQSLYSRLYRS